MPRRINLLLKSTALWRLAPTNGHQWKLFQTIVPPSCRSIGRYTSADKRLVITKMPAVAQKLRVDGLDAIALGEPRYVVRLTVWLAALA